MLQTAINKFDKNTHEKTSGEYQIMVFKGITLRVLSKKIKSQSNKILIVQTLTFRW